MIFANMPAISKRSISKWQRRFLRVLFRAVFALRGRVNFTNLARFSPLHEQTFRRHFAEGFDWIGFNQALIALAPTGSKEALIAAVDCTFVPKSGAEPYGLDQFWSGTAGRAKRGLEASVMAVIHAGSGRAFTAGAAQTPPDLSQSQSQSQSQSGGGEDWSRIDFYMQQLTACLARLGDQIRYIVADGYYAKTKVFAAVRGAGRHLITKLRTDANRRNFCVRYLYTGPRKQGPGAPKIYDGKVHFDDLSELRSRFACAGRLEDKPEVEVYTRRLNSPHFRRTFRMVVLVNTEADSYVVLASTDPDLEALKIVRFYRLRFQIELIFRDAKQFAGLTHCQARSPEKIDFHLNMSLAAVNLARLRILLSEKRISMNTYVRQAYNRWLAGHLLSKLGLQARFGLNHPQVQRVVRMGSMDG